MKNKKQLYKKLKSNKNIKYPIKVKYSDDLKKLLDIVILRYKKILVLGRNNFDIDKYFKIDKDNCFEYKGIRIKYLTIHGSKGLEEECVIIINLIDDYLGIPNKKTNDKILNYVNKNCDDYPYEEERRLFYVALTRTKNEVFLFSQKNKKSIFLKEILKENDKYLQII